MTRGLNKVMLIGNLGRDPEMRYTPSGKAVTTFSLATSRSWQSSNGERHEETEWFNIVAWGGLAEICSQHLSTGQQVYIEGRLQSRQWESDSGEKHQSMEVVAQELVMLGAKQRSEMPKQAENSRSSHG